LKFEQSQRLKPYEDRVRRTNHHRPRAEAAAMPAAIRSAENRFCESQTTTVTNANESPLVPTYEATFKVGSRPPWPR
jgi:hypothetical protein